MIAAEDSSDEENEDSEESEDSSDEENKDSKESSKQKQRFPSGDDLGDSFSVNDETLTKKGCIEKILESINEEDSGSEDGEDSDDSESSEDSDEGSDEDFGKHKNDLTLKDWEQNDDDDIGAGSEDEGDNDEDKDKAAEVLDELKILDTNRSKVGGKKSKDFDIPYIIQAPQTFGELCSLVDKCSNSNTILVINRIRKSNSIKLAVENRKKMQV